MYLIQTHTRGWGPKRDPSKTKWAQTEAKQAWLGTGDQLKQAQPGGHERARTSKNKAQMSPNVYKRSTNEHGQVAGTSSPSITKWARTSRNEHRQRWKVNGGNGGCTHSQRAGMHATPAGATATMVAAPPAGTTAAGMAAGEMAAATAPTAAAAGSLLRGPPSPSPVFLFIFLVIF